MENYLNYSYDRREGLTTVTYMYMYNNRHRWLNVRRRQITHKKLNVYKKCVNNVIFLLKRHELPSKKRGLVEVICQMTASQVFCQLAEN